MTALHLKAAVLLLTSVVPSTLCWSQTQKKQANADAKPIVALVQRTRGRLMIKINPDPSPGKDALYVFNALRAKFGSEYPVVAIVDDSAGINDLYQVSGIATKAGFGRVRTFISHRDNGRMFEVKFGPALAFSTAGPFDEDR